MAEPVNDLPLVKDPARAPDFDKVVGQKDLNSRWRPAYDTVNLADFETEFGNNLASEPADWTFKPAWIVRL
jgi:hypothetical protein